MRRVALSVLALLLALPALAQFSVNRPTDRFQRLRVTNALTVDPTASTTLGDVTCDDLTAADIVADSITTNGVLEATTDAELTTLEVSGACDLQDDVAIGDDLAINTDKFTVAGENGNTVVGGTLDVTGDVAVATNKFNVAAASGNTLVAGTLGVTGASSLAGVTCTTLAPSGNVAVATNKFTVAAASGNTLVAGTLDVTGNVAVATNKFTVAAANGNTVVAGTLGVTGVATFTAVPVLPTGGLTAGTTTLTENELGVLDSLSATKTEIQNVADVSAQLQAITEAAAVVADGTKRRATLSGGAYAITLAAPGAGAIGAILVIEYAGGDTDAVTLELTNVIGESGGTTATFNADGEGLVLLGIAGGWLVLNEFGGVTLA